MRDGSPGWAENYHWSYLFNLFQRADRNDGKGVTEHNIKKLKRMDPIIDLEPGAVAKFEVKESNDKEAWKWRYTIEVGDTKSIDHPVVGSVETVSLHEKRAVAGGDYTSKMTTIYAPSVGQMLRWEYTDSKGTQACDLVSAS